MSDIGKQESESCWKNSWKPLVSLPAGYFAMFSWASGFDVKEMMSTAAIASMQYHYRKLLSPVNDQTQNQKSK